MTRVIKYSLSIIDYDGNLVRKFDNTQIASLQFDRLRNEVSTFAAVFAENVDWVKANLVLPLALDYFIEIERYNAASAAMVVEGTYFLRSYNEYRDPQGVLFIGIGGYSLEHLLMRRIIDPVDDSRGAGGFVTDAGVSSTIINSLVTEHLGSNADTNRQIPNFTQSSDGTGLNAGGRWAYNNLFEVVQNLATKGLIEFRITRSSANNLLFEVGTLGNDKTLTSEYPEGDYILMDENRGNLIEPNLLLDYMDQMNYIYARGSGNADNETILKLQSNHITASPYNRIEFSTSIGRDDGSNALYLQTGAVSALAENQEKIEFTFPIQADNKGMMYRTDWDLMDIITVQWGSYQDDLRIVGVELRVEQDSDEIAVTAEVV